MTRKIGGDSKNIIKYSVKNFNNFSNRKRTLSYRPWGSSEDGVIEFESLTSTALEGALNVIRESFFPEENVCIGCDIQSEPGASEELEQLCMHTAKDGVSVVAIDVNTMEVVGVAFNKLHVNLKKNSLIFLSLH
ncbi:hypothetical protein KQX54_014777 [Cotesia glomerata]|uniref:Uncharacterized protein n=1 Tax=Cotesia glomerata TaxID=32391 RepID=A0AAV7IPX9_COTGL|nr:hypothetical protein KQX54_014777 [Cotesia glomerata]